MAGRIIGLEHEYGALSVFANGKLAPPSFFTIESGVERYARNLGGLFDNKQRVWLPNGGCVYQDSGHPEYATPECASPMEAVLYSRAGDMIMRKIFPEFILFKNNLSSVRRWLKVDTFGCHENYWTRFKKDEDAEEKYACSALLTPFLASRQIIDGAGWVNDENGDFFVSQRAQILHYSSTQGGNVLVSGTTMERPAFKFDNWMADGKDHYARLHLSTGDANILDFCLFLKMGLTDLVLAMLEDGFLPDWECGNSEEAFRLISQDFTGKEKAMHLYGGKEVSALEAQRFYLTAAKKYLKSEFKRPSKRKAGFDKIIRLWGKTLQALEKDDLEWLVGRIDHRTKRFLIEREKSKSDNLEFRRKIDLAYHKINEDGLGTKVRRLYAKKQFFSEKEVLSACDVCPRDSRAKIRGRIVSGVLADKKFVFLRDLLGWNIEWSNLRCGARQYDVSELKIETPLMYNPADTRMERAGRFLKKFKKFLKKAEGRLA